MRFVSAVIVVVGLMGPAGAEVTEAEGGYAKQLFSQLYIEDQELASGWDTGLSALLETLHQSDDPETLAAIPAFEDMIAAEHIPFEIGELEGEWRMRSLQANPLGAFPYQYFPARIYPEGQALVFDKNSGSQRHRGFLAQLDEQTVFFVGALYYGYEGPRIYSAMTAGETTPQQRDFDAVAEIYKIGEDHFLMAFAPEENYFRLYEIRK